MTTNADLAAALYGTQDGESTVAVPLASTTPTERADSLYPQPDSPKENPGVPDHIRELRQADTDRRMYGSQTSFASAIPDSIFDPPEGVESDVPVEVRTAAVSELREISGDLGLGTADVNLIKSRVALQRTTPTAPDVQVDEAIRGLNAAFGKDATKALRDARALVQRDPRVGKLLDSLGVANDPEVVVTIAHAARRERTRGRLR